MILYTKFSNERDRAFAVRTEISEEDGVRHVRKYPQTPAAGGHVKHIAGAYRILEKLCDGTCFAPNRLKELPDGGIEFEFLEGETLEEIIDRRLASDVDAAWLVMDQYLAEIDKMAKVFFVETEGFRKVFGSADGKLDGLRACAGADIDLVLDNILVQDDVWNIMDYEWTFDFPVPVEFIKWRILFYYERGAGILSERGRSAFSRAGIEESRRKIYQRMEFSFQRYIEGDHIPLRNLYHDVSPGRISFPEADRRIQHERSAEKAELFLDCGEGFAQKTAERLCADEDGAFVLEIGTKNLKAVRIDPASAPCLVHIRQLITDKGPEAPEILEGNGTFFCENGLIFNGSDPQIVIRAWNQAATVLHIEFDRIVFYDTDEMSRVASWLAEGPGKTTFAGHSRSLARIWRGEICETVPVVKWEDGSEEAELHIDSAVTHVDIIPGGRPCLLTIKDISTDQGVLDISAMSANGLYLEDNVFFFDSDAPVLSVSGWKAGSRLMNISFTKVMVDNTAAKALEKRFETLENLVEKEREGNRDKAGIIAERDAQVKYIANMRAVRAIRKAREELGKGDMFAPFKTIRPGADPILYNIEQKRYGKKAFHVYGWCADPDFDRVDIRILDGDKKLVNARIPRRTRADVAVNLRIDPNGMYGFEIIVPYREIRTLPLQMELGNPRGVMTVDLAYEPDPSGREIEKQQGQAETERYDMWYRKRRPGRDELRAQQSVQFQNPVLFSIVVPLFKTPEKYLDELIESVRTQTYGNWELILSDGSGADSPLAEMLDQWAAKDSRIRPLHHESALHISENTNAAILGAKGDYIVFCDHDDLLAPEALFENMKLIGAHPEAEAIYSDEDKLTPEGTYTEPNFKPDFDEDYLDSVNYICHLLVAKRTLLEKIGLLNPDFDGAQDYDLVLRIAEQTKFFHIPKILYHWRLSENSTAENPESKRYAFEAGRRAIKAHYDRMGVPAAVEKTAYTGIYRTRYHFSGQPKVSVIIPNYEHPDLLKQCVDSITEKCQYPNYEIVVIENNSKKQETFDLYGFYQRTLPNFKLVTYEGPFNYSAINNFGVSKAEGEYLLFLNNDTEFKGENVLEELLQPCMRDDVGAVGARLYYEDGTIQHAGTILGIGGVAGNAFVGYPGDAPGYMGRIVSASDLSCVTAACMMVKRSVFEKIGGFYEGLAVAFNDVDLCMKIRKEGFLIEYNPWAELFHYESKSRGYEDSVEKRQRFDREVALFQKRWGGVLAAGDPYYNPNLTLKRQDFSLKDDDEK